MGTEATKEELSEAEKVARKKLMVAAIEAHERRTATNQVQQVKQEKQ